jgi:hypothetical protein
MTCRPNLFNLVDKTTSIIGALTNTSEIGLIWALRNLHLPICRIIGLSYTDGSSANKISASRVAMAAFPSRVAACGRTSCFH